MHIRRFLVSVLAALLFAAASPHAQSPGAVRNQRVARTSNTSSSSRPTIWRDAATARRAWSVRRSTSPDQFRAAGLAPGVNGSWFQPFQIVTGLEVREGNKLAIAGEKGPTAFELGRTYLPLSVVTDAAAAGRAEAVAAARVRRIRHLRAGG